MRKEIMAVSLLFAINLPAFAGSKLQGPTTLKDLQPFGTIDKDHKHQAYDLSFPAQGKNYTCRTDSGNRFRRRHRNEIPDRRQQSQDKKPAGQRGSMQNRSRRSSPLTNNG